MPTKEEMQQVFPTMQQRFQPDKAKGVDATIQFDLSGDNGGMFWLKITEGTCEHGEGTVENAAMILKAKDEDFYAMVTGKVSPMQAFMMGKIKVNNMELGLKMTTMFQMG